MILDYPKKIMTTIVPNAVGDEFVQLEHTEVENKIVQEHHGGGHQRSRGQSLTEPEKKKDFKEDGGPSNLINKLTKDAPVLQPSV
uniref:Uncharacterized protein n=1 Tax=Panagrolaimus sp. ES5 TaxID=591445 RepID=A0AC34F6S4_9BILA